MAAMVLLGLRLRGELEWVIYSWLGHIVGLFTSRGGSGVGLVGWVWFGYGAWVWFGFGWVAVGLVGSGFGLVWLPKWLQWKRGEREGQR